MIARLLIGPLAFYAGGYRIWLLRAARIAHAEATVYDRTTMPLSSGVVPASRKRAVGASL